MEQQKHEAYCSIFLVAVRRTRSRFRCDIDLPHFPLHLPSQQSSSPTVLGSVSFFFLKPPWYTPVRRNLAPKTRFELPQTVYTMEVITIGVSQETHANSIKRTHRKRKVKRSQRQNVGLAHMPSEVLELIFVDLDPQSVSSVTSASRRFCSLGTNTLHRSF